MQDLPTFYHSAWTSTFLPTYIMRVGADDSPWSPTFDTIKAMQEIRDEVYETSQHLIDKDSAVHHIVGHPHSWFTHTNTCFLVLQVQQRVFEWRSSFGVKAVAVVSQWLENKQLFPTTADVAARVKYLLGNDSPWLWGNGLEPPAKGEVCIPHIPSFQY